MTKQRPIIQFDSNLINGGGQQEQHANYRNNLVRSSIDSGRDNPFRPDGEIYKSADPIVDYYKFGPNQSRTQSPTDSQLLLNLYREDGKLSKKEKKKAKKELERRAKRRANGQATGSKEGDEQGAERGSFLRRLLCCCCCHCFTNSKCCKTNAKLKNEQAINVSPNSHEQQQRVTDGGGGCAGATEKKTKEFPVIESSATATTISKPKIVVLNTPDELDQVSNDAATGGGSGVGQDSTTIQTTTESQQNSKTKSINEK